jgi:alpha-D-ribose 1-methylphosphonate 5-triphosphate synthase subunit PhnG
MMNGGGHMNIQRSPVQLPFQVAGTTRDLTWDYICALEQQRAELLALCKRALEQSARVHADFYEALRAAIAKATQEEVETKDLDLDDTERHYEPDEKVDPQTGFVE